MKGFQRSFAKFDMFGYNIKIKHNNGGEYKSIFGSAFSVFVYIVLITQIISTYEQYKINNLNPCVNSWLLQTPAQTVNISAQNSIFNIAFMFSKDSDPDTLFSLDPSYANIKFYSIFTNALQGNSTTVERQLKTCNFDFKEDAIVYEAQYLENFKNQELLCLRNPEDQLSENDILIIKDDAKSLEASSLIIDIEKCNGMPHCKSSSEIEAYISELNIQLLVYNNYFSPFDQVNLLRRNVNHLSYKPINYLDSGIYTQTTISLYNNLVDEYYNIIRSKKRVPTKNMITFTESTTLSSSSNKNLSYSLTLKASTYVSMFSLKFYTLIDILSDIGGLVSIFAWIGSSIFTSVNKKLFFKSLINEHFDICKDDNNSTHVIYKPTVENNQAISEGPQNINLVKNNLSFAEKLKANIDRGKAAHKVEMKGDDKFFYVKNREDEQKETLLEQDNSRFKFNYTIKDISYRFASKYLFCLYPFKERTRKQMIYKKCKHILEGYLTLNSLIKTMQEFNIMKSVFFDENSKELIGKNRKPILKVSDDHTIIIYRTSEGQLENDESEDSPFENEATELKDKAQE